MNRIKSIFITVFIIILFIGLIYNGIQFFQERSEVKYLAGALVSLIPLFYFSYLYLKKPANVKAGIMVATALISTTFIITTGRTLFEIQGLDMVFVLSLINIMGWILYLTWYSKYKNRDSKHLLQTELNGLVFKKENGERFELVQDSNNYHILLFHRGNWCPFCMAQVRDIANQYQDLIKRKVAVHIISPANEKWTKKLSDKYNVNFNYLIDDKLEVAKRLKIYQANGIPLGFEILGFDSDTVLPTVILLDKNLRVLRVHETDDYKNRPEPNFFLRLIDSY